MTSSCSFHVTLIGVKQNWDKKIDLSEYRVLKVLFPDRKHLPRVLSYLNEFNIVVLT